LTSFPSFSPESPKDERSFPQMAPQTLHKTLPVLLLP
jgi:hypothetical protein